MATLLFFGALQDIMHGQQHDMALSQPLPLHMILAIITENNRTLALALADERVRFARNGEFVDSNAMIADGDELAFLPPVSGG